MIHFLLTPDKSSSLALKRRIAEQYSCMDVIVGTWSELLTQTKNSHILPLHKDNWQEKLAKTVKEIESAFWTKSLNNVPSESDAVVEIIGRHLAFLLEGVGPNRDISFLREAELTGRLGCRVADFIVLHEKMDGILPADLAAIKAIIDAGPERQLRPMRVYHLDGLPKLNPWQQILVSHLNTHADREDGVLRQLLQDLFVKPAASPQTSLRFMQDNLFSLPQKKTFKDETLQWLSLRDYLQEIEVCASMVQKTLQDNAGSLKASDIAVLVPDDDLYVATSHAVFSSAGITLSDPGYESIKRDIGAETVLNLLLTLKKPAPVLAIASLLTSPLMPWDISIGNLFAQKVVEGKYKLDEFPEADQEYTELLKMLRQGASSGKQLKFILSSISKSLNTVEKLKIHVKRAQQLCLQLSETVAAAGDIPWDSLISKIAMEPVKGESCKTLYREGVALFREGCEPWRTVKRLYVLGCSEGHYPAGTSVSQVFSETDLILLRENAGIAVETPSDRNHQQRQIFKRQIASTSDQVTFFVPRRDALGKVLPPSPSLTFAASLFDECDEDNICYELETSAGRKLAVDVPVCSVIPSCEPLQIPDVFRFESNLLQNSDGSMKIESPSRLETLMVAPMAWLFERLGIKAREWQPEKLDIMAKGTLAHNVFEVLFMPEKPLPSTVEIGVNVPLLLLEAIKKQMVFLMNDEWKVERAHLEKDILKAAKRWGEILREIGAEVIATEIPLEGKLDGIPIHGNADLLLSLPNDRLYVVDYKKSTNKDRRIRMIEGYDHQAELYRTMIKTGGLEKPEKAPPGMKERLELFKNAGEIGTLYYLMNDQTVLADTRGWLSKCIGGVEEVDSDTSVQAMKLIRERFSELSRGIINLQLKEKEKDLKDKLGLEVYALDSSPLIKMYVREPIKEET